MNRDLEVSLSQLNLNLFLRSLSKQTFYKILNEKSHMVLFRPGQLVMPINPGSPWNNNLYQTYKQMQQRMLDRVDDCRTQVTLHLASGPKEELKEQWD